MFAFLPQTVLIDFENVIVITIMASVILKFFIFLKTNLVLPNGLTQVLSGDFILGFFTKLSSYHLAILNVYITFMKIFQE